jgi:hypothetical protein
MSRLLRRLFGNSLRRKRKRNMEIYTFRHLQKILQEVAPEV